MVRALSRILMGMRMDPAVSLCPGCLEALATDLITSWQPGQVLANGLLHTCDQCLRQAAMLVQMRLQSGQVFVWICSQEACWFPWGGLR